MRKSLLALAALLALSGGAMAHEYDAGNLHIAHPWSLLLPAASANGAAYFVVHNKSNEADRLLGADTDRAASAEIHQHVEKDGMMKMLKVDGADVPANGMLTFAPGGYHLMLMGLKKPLVDGERFPVTLHFQKAGDVKVEVLVQKNPPEEEHTAHDMHDMPGMKMDMKHE